MSLSVKGASVGDRKLSAAATLNPNATEFVPFALRSQATGISIPDGYSKFSSSAAATLGKSILHRSESSVSNNSEEEAQRYWRHQLPDDITPDFKVMGMDDTQGINSFSLSNLSLTDVNEGSRHSSSTNSGFMLTEQQGLSLRPLRGSRYAEKLNYPVSSYGEYSSPTSFRPSLAETWEKQIAGNDQLLAREGHLYNGNSSQSNEQLFLENADVGPLEFLASIFPCFAAESLAEVYISNGGDLNLTIEMLTQLEVDGGLNQTLNSKTLSTPNLSALDFLDLPLPDSQNALAMLAGDDHDNVSPYRPLVKDSTLLFRSFSSIPPRGATNLASAVRKMVSQDSSIWKYERNGSSDTSIGSTRNSQVLASLYNSGRGKGNYGDRMQNLGSAHASPVWLETGEAVANMYSEMRGEARDYACVRNAYFEQARQAYLIGNKALAKELSIKGQLHDMQVKAAHGKAEESIYRLRNPDMQANRRERIIDLRGLHVSEAFHVLKRELAVLRNAARSTDQRLLVYVCLGAGHHSRGSRTSARLPTAVQRYLLEEEGLDYSEPQPGILRVVIY